MELRQLETFICVAEELHFGRAARRLNVSQPPLSRTIRSLERELRIQLFDRDRHHVRLTDAGGVFLEYARRIVSEVRRAGDAARAIAAGETGTLTVGFAASAALNTLPEAVRRFRSQRPDVVLVLEELTSVRQLERLQAGSLDIGIVRGPVNRPPDGFRFEVLEREQLHVAVPVGHRLARAKRVRLEQLRDEAFVLFPRSAAPGFHDQIISACRHAGFSPRIIQEATEYQTLVSLVASGLGITLVPDSVRTLKRRGVRFVPLTSSRAFAELVAAHHTQSRPLAERFLSILRGTIGHQ